MKSNKHRVMIVDRVVEEYDSTGLWCDGMACVDGLWIPHIVNIPFSRRDEVHTGYTIDIVRDRDGVWFFNRVLRGV